MIELELHLFLVGSEYSARNIADENNIFGVPRYGAWLVGYQILPNQNYGKPKLRYAKIKTAKIRAKNIGVHLVSCQIKAC
jgi:hypothetical protein